MNDVVTSMTLTQTVAEHLRSLIHRGEFGPGDRLPPERELAEQIGVARVSLREAIKILQDSGYVEVRHGGPKGGTFVTQLNRPVEAWRARMREQAGEIDDIIDYRIALETHAAGLAAQRRTRAELTAIGAAIAQLDTVTSLAQFRLADTRFHGSVATAARNARLENAIHTARGELFGPHDLLAYKEPVEESRHDHRLIYTEIRDRNDEAAAQRMREHIERTREQLRVIVFGTADQGALPSPSTVGAPSGI